MLFYDTQYRLKDYCLVGDGAHASIRREESGVMYLTSKNFKNDGLNLSKIDFISWADYEKHFKKSRGALVQPTPGDIVFGIIGTIGTPYIVKENDLFGLSSSVGILRPTEEVDCRFLYYYMTSSPFQLAVEGMKGGSAQGFLSLEMIKNLPLLKPEILVQKKIAAVLSAYDELIEVNNRRIALLEKMAEELYREWFVRLRFPGHQKTKFHKGIPEGWGTTKLGEIATVLMGQSPKSEFYNKAGEGLPFHQGVGTYGQRFPKKETYCSTGGRTAQVEDILFSVRAPVGRLNIADCRMIIGRGLSALRHNKGFNSYLYYLLRVTFSGEDMIGNGAIFNSVGKDELLSVDLLSPFSSLVERFNQIASQIDRQIKTYYESLDVLTKTRDRLLPRLISGKLSVEALEIEFPPGMEE